MSELRIALVSEGPTDFIVIEAALRAILSNSFVLNKLHPEPTRPDLGNGWGGVFKWCQEFRSRGYPSFEDDPTLNIYDLVVVHLDADVASKSYADCGAAVELKANSLNLSLLPCAQPCPPHSATVNGLETVMLSWLNMAQLGAKSLFCIPSKATEAWLSAAVLADQHTLLSNIECNLNLERDLAQLPKAQRIKKNVLQYRGCADQITSEWDRVKLYCSQAVAFENKVKNLLSR